MRNLALIIPFFEERMRGRPLADAELAAAARWIEAIPPPPARRDRATVSSRGAESFTARCARCHAGERLTDNRSVDLGFGQMQVPSLVGVAWRAPFRHDGCAHTLEDRFVVCRDSAHDAAELDPGELDALVAYLGTL